MVWAILQLCGGASCSGPAQLYRLYDGEWTQVIDSPDAFTPPKQLVLDGSGQGWLFWDGIVYQLEGESARPVAELAALAAEAGPDGSVGVLAGSDANAGLWATQPSPQPVPTPPFTPAGMSFLPAGLAVINPQNAAGLEPLASLPEAGAGVVAFSPDSRRLAAGLFRTNAVKIWDLASGDELHTLNGHTDPRIISYLAFSPDGAELASGAQAWDGPNDSLILWDSSTGRELQRFTGFLGAVSPDWGSVALTQREQPQGAALILSDLDSGEKIYTLPAPGDIYGISFAPGGGQVAAKMYSIYQDLFAFWSVDSGRLDHTLYDWAGFSYSPDGRYFAALVNTGAGDRDELNLYAADTFKWLRTLASDADSLWYTYPAFSPDGGIVAASRGDRVTLWDTQTGEWLASLPITGPAGQAFSPDGRILATYTHKGEIQLWGVEEGG
jgi:WD40 repeat protein